MKNRIRKIEESIIVICFIIFITSCRTVESYRDYDPETDSVMVRNIESIVLKDGSVINLDINCKPRVITDSNSAESLSFVCYDTVWNSSHSTYNVITKSDTISFDNISEIRVDEANTVGTMTVVIGSVLFGSVLMSIIMEYSGALNMGF